MAPDSAVKPLDGVRVLDLSRVLAGPWSAQLLADLGADVVKVENPRGGDDTRLWGKPRLSSADQSAHETAFFLAANRGKRSLVADLATEAGAATVRELATHADVLIENFKVGGLARYGLDAASLHALNPRLIYCSITGFGQDGPYAARAGYDVVVQGMGGLMSVTGHPDGEPGGGPLRVGAPITDILTGLYASSAILAALHERKTTGRGRHIDLALLDVQLAVLAQHALAYLGTGEDPQRIGNSSQTVSPYDVYETSDRPIIIATGNEAQFQRLCDVLGTPELASDPAFASNALRVANRVSLKHAIDSAMASQGAEYWCERLDAAGVPAGPINRMSDALNDPQIVHRGLQVTLDHDTLGRIPAIASPIRFDGAPMVSRRAPPALGKHTDEVLAGWLKPGEHRVDDQHDMEAAG